MRVAFCLPYEGRRNETHCLSLASVRCLPCGMKQFAFGIGLTLVAGSLVPANAQTPFPDIAPCHWAAEAVTEIAGTPEVETNQARNSVYLAGNAVQQVFEGLRCGTPEWSQAFLDGEPDTWPADFGAVEFSLQLGEVRLSDNTGTASVDLSLTAQGESVDRSGQVDLTFDAGRWRVSYASLAQLDLPLFPR